MHVAGNLPIKILVARQLPTNAGVCILYTHVNAQHIKILLFLQVVCTCTRLMVLGRHINGYPSQVLYALGPLPWCVIN